MTDLTAVVTDTAKGRTWSVRGEHGAVSVELISAAEGVFGPIVVHHVRPVHVYGELHREPEPCNILDGTCYPDPAFRAGDTLGRTWQASGRNDQAIWTQLESWYRLRLGDLAECDESAAANA